MGSGWSTVGRAPEIHGSNPVIDEFYLPSTALKRIK